MCILKKFTSYQKDLLVLVRTNLVYLMVEWKRMNLIDRDISLFLFILEQINLQKCVVLCGILIKSYIFHVPYILFLSSPLKMRKSKVTCLCNYCFLQFQTPKYKKVLEYENKVVENQILRNWHKFRLQQQQYSNLIWGFELYIYLQYWNFLQLVFQYWFLPIIELAVFVRPYCRAIKEN